MKAVLLCVLFLAAAHGASICDKYSDTLDISNLDLVTTVVGETFSLAIADNSTIRQYFNGTVPPGSIDYTTDTSAAEDLATSLIRYFGIALGCTDGTIGNYTGNPDMKAVHAGIPITYQAYRTFNLAVLHVMGDNGVSQDDLEIVSGVLRSLKDDICNQDDCQTICNRYSDALDINNSDLVTLVVGNTFALITADNSTIKQYFNGSVPAGSIDYTSNPTAAENLAGKLVEYFGDVLGCSDGTIPAYSGNPDMKAVHAGIPITYEAYRVFNQVVLLVMENSGVAEDDLDTVSGVLRSLKEDICNQPDCDTICNRYSDALDVANYDLVENVVVDTFTLVTNATSPIRGFFNGTIPEGSTDFLTNDAARASLVKNLVEFFGQDGILSCTDGSIGPYTGNPDMAAVHSAMPIGQLEFDSFNNALLQVVTEAGLDQEDLDAISDVLQSTKDAICNQCPGETTEITSDSAQEESASATLVAALSIPMVLLSLS